MIDQILDLSHPINGLPCTSDTTARAPTMVFTEGEVRGTRTDTLGGIVSGSFTHIDLPGHLPQSGAAYRSVGQFDLKAFLAERVAVLDVSARLTPLSSYFDASGMLTIHPRDEQTLFAFLCDLDTLEITLQELKEGIAQSGAAPTEIDGLLLYTGLSAYWKAGKYEASEYIYYFAPFLSRAACQFLVQQGIKLVGIDAAELDHPIINYQGDELPLVLNPTCRRMVNEKQERLPAFFNHHALLGTDILIYENLHIPRWLAGRTVGFAGVPLPLQLEGVTNNALVRPYAIL